MVALIEVWSMASEPSGEYLHAVLEDTLGSLWNGSEESNVTLECSFYPIRTANDYVVDSLCAVCYAPYLLVTCLTRCPLGYVAKSTMGRVDVPDLCRHRGYLYRRGRCR